MSLRALPLLLLAGLGVVCAEESAGPWAPAAAPRRRYSEATLASDYSRAMDTVLGRNFVEWLLARRERGSPDVPEPLKREAEPQKASEEEKFEDLGGKDFGKNPKKPSFPALEGSEGLREFLEQELLLWLMSGELCRATTT